MTGPEHYKEAERLEALAFAGVELIARQVEGNRRLRLDDLAAKHQALGVTLHRAQVHATLALAAATAEGLADTPEQVIAGTSEWAEAIS